MKRHQDQARTPASASSHKLREANPHPSQRYSKASEKGNPRTQALSGYHTATASLFDTNSKTVSNHHTTIMPLPVIPIASAKQRQAPEEQAQKQHLVNIKSMYPQSHSLAQQIERHLNPQRPPHAPQHGQRQARISFRSPRNRLHTSKSK